MKILTLLPTLLLASLSVAQAKPKPAPPVKDAKPSIAQEEIQRRLKNMATDEINGVSVRIKDVARFRGVRSNQIMGIGLVVGLAGTGDSRRNQQTATAITNYLRTMNLDINPLSLETRNSTLVILTADLPAFSSNGQTLDVTVSTMGDASSLRGGTLLRSELYATGDNETIYAVAQGSVSVGGFGAAAGGNQATVGFLTAGRVPGGAIVERGAPTKLVYEGKMYVELDEADITTAIRVQEAISKRYPEWEPEAINGGTVAFTPPRSLSPLMAMSKIEAINVMVDSEAVVIINDRTGTVVIGGNVRIAPVAVATSTISVRIEEEVSVSQPNPFSKGQTAVVANQNVNAKESEADVAIVAPTTTIADLARIFQELRLKATDIINILQMLKQQGALKAKLIIQ
jgi:flagellar P-ring protein FlgI